MDSVTYTLLSSTSSTTKLLTSTLASLSNETNSAADLTKTLVPEKYQIILLSFAYGIISFLAVVGNSSIIYIVVRNRRMHSVTNYFICNLALSDCLVAFFAVPFQVSPYLYTIKQTQIFFLLVSSCSSSKMGTTSFSL
jgi:hypothetical protein